MENVRRFVGKQRCVVRALVGAKPDVILVGKGARIESSRRLPVLWIGVHAHGSEIGVQHGLTRLESSLSGRCPATGEFLLTRAASSRNGFTDFRHGGCSPQCHGSSRELLNPDSIRLARHVERRHLPVRRHLRSFTCRR
jgi:hypothetical protein